MASYNMFPLPGDGVMIKTRRTLIRTIGAFILDEKIADPPKTHRFPEVETGS